MLHEDGDYDPRIDVAWEKITEEQFLSWVYRSIGDDSVDVMLEIDSRIKFLKENK